MQDTDQIIGTDQPRQSSTHSRERNFHGYLTISQNSTHDSVQGRTIRAELYCRDPTLMVSTSLNAAWAWRMSLNAQRL